MQLLQKTSGEKAALRVSGRSSELLELYRFQISPRAVGFLCLITLCATLVAGLWPFCAPENQVSWAKNENAIVFGKNGTALSSRQLDLANVEGAACSVEAWVQPKRIWTTGVVLSVYDSRDRREFTLEQDYTDLVLRRGDGSQDERRLLRIQDVFRKPEAFINVTSDGQKTQVYIDGQWVLGSSEFQLSNQDLSGQLILANAAFFDRSWSGQMKGLAIYTSELNAAQILEHYQDWTQRGRATSGPSDQPLASYTFGEHNGSIIHDAAPSGIDLRIPRRFLVIDQLLFQSPVMEFRTQPTYLKNALINVAGFIPLGFMLSLYFAGVRRMRGAAIVAVLAGAAVSFAIEYFQSFLPTRYSGWTDILTNVIGTGIGAGLYWHASRFVASKSRVGSSRTQLVQ
jgi:VanZ family protein